MKYSNRKYTSTQNSLIVQSSSECKLSKDDSVLTIDRFINMYSDYQNLSQILGIHQANLVISSGHISM